MKLSQAELDTMLVLWECDEPIRPSSLLKIMEKTHKWSISTLKTLLTRLEEKGFLEVVSKKRFLYYFPKITKKQYFEMEAESLMTRLNTSSPLSLMAGFISNNITEDELCEMEELLKEARKRLSSSQ